MDRWITDTEPSARFPVYTRANAGEVLPEPVSPLGWTLVWEPGVVMGWADTQVNVGTLEREEMDPVLPEVLGCFGGYLYINVAMARIFGTLGAAFEVGGQQVRILVKAGASVFPTPTDGDSADALLTNAEAALKKAKATPETLFFYAPHLNAAIANRVSLENALSRAV